MIIDVYIHNSLSRCANIIHEHEDWHIQHSDMDFSLRTIARGGEGTFQV